MIELSASDFSKVAPILKGIQIDIVYAHAVLEGRQTGRVFVDDAVNPSAVLIWHYCGNTLLTGESCNTAFASEVCGLLLGKRSEEFPHLRISAYPGEWNAVLKKQLNDKLIRFTDLTALSENDSNKWKELESKAALQKVVEYSRTVFEFRREVYEKWRHEFILPDGYQIKRLKRDLFIWLEGKVVPKHYWDTPEAFEKNGLGVCLVEGDKIACAAFSAYVGNGKIDIGIETMPEYRQKGFGALTAAAMIELCLENGFAPVWGCRSDNKGSFSLAQKIGFVPVGFHPIYFAVRNEMR